MREGSLNNRHTKVLIVSLLLVYMLAAGSAANFRGKLAAQSLVTATPVQIFLPTATIPEVQQEVTPTFTPTTQIEQVGAVTGVTLEARTDSGAVNVRSEPDPNAEILGTINSGATYPVTGRYFRWIQFRYERTGSGLAWVFDGLVNLTGDVATIPEIDPFAVPTADPFIVNATQTASIITLTPGAAAIIAVTSGTPLRTNDDPAVLGGEGNVPLPTYTYPPEIIAAAPTQSRSDNDLGETATTNTESISPSPSASGDIAPIIPIALLGGLGLLGLLLSALRR